MFKSGSKGDGGRVTNTVLVFAHTCKLMSSISEELTALPIPAILSLKAQPFLHLFGRESLLLTLRFLEIKVDAINKDPEIKLLVGLRWKSSAHVSSVRKVAGFMASCG